MYTYAPTLRLALRVARRDAGRQAGAVLARAAHLLALACLLPDRRHSQILGRNAAAVRYLLRVGTWAICAHPGGPRVRSAPAFRRERTSPRSRRRSDTSPAPSRTRHSNKRTAHTKPKRRGARLCWSWRARYVVPTCSSDGLRRNRCAALPAPPHDAEWGEVAFGRPRPCAHFGPSPFERPSGSSNSHPLPRLLGVQGGPKHRACRPGQQARGD